MPAFGGWALSGNLYDLLTKTEREVLKVTKSPTLPKTFVPKTVAPANYPAIHSAGDFPDGYVADVLRQTECRAKETAVAAGALVRVHAAQAAAGTPMGGDAVEVPVRRGGPLPAGRGVASGSGVGEGRPAAAVRLANGRAIPEMCGRLPYEPAQSQVGSDVKALRRRERFATCAPSIRRMRKAAGGRAP